MNYRHAFHAGNFADLVKHAALLQLLARLTGEGGPLTVIDTHAGGGLYDLAGVEAKKSGEAEAGIARLMDATDAPAEFAPLTAAVGALTWMTTEAPESRLPIRSVKVPLVMVPASVVQVRWAESGSGSLTLTL